MITPYVNVLKKYKNCFIIACVVVFSIGVGTGYLNSSYNKRMELMTDVKDRCKPVYKRVESNYVTTIYTCPDDTQYEFKERL